MSTQFKPLLTEQLYDDLNRPALSTVAVASAERASLGFAAGLIADRNPAQGAACWQGGALHGEISTWIDRGSFVRPQDPEYAYQGSYFEPDPVSRALAMSSPGTDFRRESAHAIRLTAGDLPEAASSSFQDQLNISSRVQSGYFLTSAAETSLGKLGKLSRARLKELDGRAAASVSLDEAGHAILTATGYTTGAGLSTGLGTNTGTQTPIMSTTQTLQPNYYDTDVAEPANFVTTTQADALERTVFSYSSDTGITLSYYDTYQRLRFSQTAFQAGNNGKISPIVIYYLYDALNRPVETGFFPGAWDNETLQGLCLGTGTPQPDGAFPLCQSSYDQLPGATALDPFSQGKLVQTVSWNSCLTGSTIAQNAASQLTETLSYDYKGRITAVTVQLLGGTAYTTQYAYDNLDHVTEIVHPDGFSVTYSYNLQGQVNAIGTPDIPDYFAAYTYTAQGMIASETLAPSSTYPVVRSFTYGNSLFQLTGISDSLGLFSETLVYTDGSDNLSGDYQDGNIQTLSVSYGAAVQAQYPSYQFELSYDSFRRLVAVNCPQNENWSVASIGYDANGNQQNYNGAQYTYAYNPGTNQLSQIQLSVPADDSSFSYDASGRTSAAYDITQITYDELSALPVQLIRPDQSNTQINLIYDRSGERFQKQYTQNGQEVYLQTYIRGNGNLALAEYLSEYDTVFKRYVYGPSGLIYTSWPGDESDEEYWVLKDHLGSLRVSYQAGTGTVDAYCSFDSFGREVDANNSTDDYTYLFCSQEIDSELGGVYNFHARQYSPEIARFLTPDPMAQFPSPYLYAGNNPLNDVDPSGMTDQNFPLLIASKEYYISDKTTNNRRVVKSALKRRLVPAQNLKYLTNPVKDPHLLRGGNSEAYIFAHGSYLEHTDLSGSVLDTWDLSVSLADAQGNWEHYGVDSFIQLLDDHGLFQTRNNLTIYLALCSGYDDIEPKQSFAGIFAQKIANRYPGMDLTVSATNKVLVYKKSKYYTDNGGWDTLRIRPGQEMTHTYSEVGPPLLESMREPAVRPASRCVIL